MNVSTTEPPFNKTSHVLAQHQNYCKAFSIAQKLATTIIASESPTREFENAMDCLQQIVLAWEEGKQ